MHDLRVRRRADRATDGGRLKVTLTQLWYACVNHHSAWEAVGRRGTPPMIRAFVAIPVVTALLVVTGLTAWPLALVPSGAALGVLVAAVALRHREGRPAGSRITPPRLSFTGLMRNTWTPVYGRLPAGVVDDPPPAAAPPAPEPLRQPRAVLLCTDAPVAHFLRVNGVPARLRAVLVEVRPSVGASRRGARTKDALARLAPFRPAVPLVLVRDQDAEGALLAAVLRAARPGQIVVDVCPPRTGPGGRDAVTVLTGVRDFSVEELRALGGLSADEAARLAAGFVRPVAAVPPPVLMSVVEQAVARAVALAPAGARDAGGFLSWPPRPDQPHGPARGKGGVSS
ncbi:hypothetical protein [uncultured Streptomyces sp.]|uniref:hypothetical protein n=1 Tax=uncultured Streptomyces sp. TaxID=174707 RepID=UPI002616C819|nr:hypothetical protein [uncultured Streptomyces sp.]